MHCLSDVSCRLTMDGERLHGSFSQNGRENIIFFLSESILECYKSLRDGLGAYAPSYATVRH